MTNSLYQTTQWKNACIRNGKVSVNFPYLIAFEEDRKIPFFKRLSILTAEGMPNLSDKHKIVQALNEFKEKSNRYSYGTIYPPVVNPSDNLFKEAGFKKVTNYTCLINLKKTTDELLRSLEKKSARWGVKTGQKNGLTFNLAKSKSEVKDFYKLYQKTAESGGFKATSYEFIEYLADTEISKLFLVKRNNEILAGGLLLVDHWNNYSVINLTASSEEGQKLQSMPFLYWNLILYSKGLKLNYLDLGGYDKEAYKGDKTYSINKFKENFGGEVVEQPIYSTNWKYPLIRKVFKRFKTLRYIFWRSR